MARSAILLRLSLGAFLAGLLVPAPASAQPMNIAVSRLHVPNMGANSCSFAGGTPSVCQDDDAWRRVMTQFGGSMIPPVLTPAGTRGVKGLYIGLSTSITGINTNSSTTTGQDWHRAVEGDGMSHDPTRARFVGNTLIWNRLNVRKGLPFGFELGTNIGFLTNTSYWAAGLSIRWSLFEGFRQDVGWIPDVAVRGAVQTLMGDSEFDMTVPSVGLILSEPFVIENTVEVIPSIVGQVAWIFADSELVDLSPSTPAVPPCMPDPALRAGSPPYCTGSGAQLNYDVVFPSLRSMRGRAGATLQIRYEWFTLTGNFMFDLFKPGQLDSSLPQDLPRQWQANIGAGLSL